MIGIHSTSNGFSERWVAFCEEQNVPYRIVDCTKSNIVEQLEGCDALLWHWLHYDRTAALCARQITMALEHQGVRVFPDTASAWHYDDKLGQKYVLEAIGAPLVPTFVAYNEKDAMQWAATAVFPKVFKLRGGAGSENVRLVKNLSQAQRFIRRSFHSGWRAHSRFHPLSDRWWQFRRERTLSSLAKLAFGIGRSVFPHQSAKGGSRQVGYVYFQDFIPGNTFDVRVIIIGNRAFAIKRLTREGDFRASGSGLIIHDPEQIPTDCIRVAFSVARKLKSKSVAFDFVQTESGPGVVEISYAFSTKGYRDCPGYWDGDLKWYPGMFFPEDFMIEDLLASIESSKMGVRAS